MKKHSLYNKLTRYYDLIYSWRDYKKDANKIKKLISKYKKSKGNELLDVACGTGKHLKFLKNKFFCVGIDSSREMLKIGRKNTEGVKFKLANMINFNLNRRFDAIICMFSSICHVKTYSNLRKTIQNFAKHLKKGGVVIIEGFITRSSFITGLYMNTYQGTDIKIARINTSRLRGNMVILDMHYLIGEKNKGVKHFIERFELGLFDTNKTLAFMKNAGLKSKFLKNGFMKDRGIYIGVKND